ncbi:hybrid sensor histidine kinase/response regulator [Sulfitobacter sp. SK012]|uniref:response regulator n=1 Tax=Sulfitobacter sp. SK012 TaxID=1389005 RepID=UPI000E0B5767|nr:response regulator [Sulfitobacter sp. SK012]AXI44829.1 hybrid sensor histidine kinase/response regulator [Sulfitobacter sp. SK012]
MSLANKLTEERRSRLAAERMLELKQAELFAANRKLGKHALQLTNEIVETRAEVETIRGENKRVKSDLTVANEKIAVAERRLWHSIETIKDGFAFFNSDNEMIIANKAYVDIFDGLEVIQPGVNYVTILQVMTDEGIVDPGDLTLLDWRNMMTERLHMQQPDPVVVRLWDGAHIRLLDQRGSGGDMVSLGINITSSVRYEEQLKEARAIAESANRAKSSFLANMSHEIRTPMNGVVGMADVLADTDLSEEQLLYVDTIKNSGEALLVIINDVLDYSKIEAKKLEIHPEPFDLERAIQEVMMLLQPAAREKELALLLDYDLFLPNELIGDPGRIRQVLTNLMGNAVKFTAQGHVLVRVTGISDIETGDVSVHIAIEDTGIGIPEDMVAHIFGEFNQVENERNRQFDGTGLGLAISQRLIDMMGGEMWVTSEEGVGSCFGLKLGMKAVNAITLAPPPLPAGVHQAMIIDPIAANRKVLERQLDQLGLKVISCAGAEDALAQIGPHVDVVLCEHILPGMDGLTLATRLHEGGHDAPFILLSSNPDQAEKDPAGTFVSAILRKPLPRRDLITALQGLGSHVPTAAIIQRQVRVLAAEDNKTNQLVFRKMVKDLDIELKFANNGHEAVALFQSFAPDIIFMDISMPKMDGKEATRAIRAIERKSGTSVSIVALTAHAMDGDDQGILAAGLDHYLTKPLRKPAILERMVAAQPEGARPVIAPAVDDQLAR